MNVTYCTCNVTVQTKKKSVTRSGLPYECVERQNIFDIESNTKRRCKWYIVVCEGEWGQDQISNRQKMSFSDPYVVKYVKLRTKYTHTHTHTHTQRIGQTNVIRDSNVLRAQ